MGFFNEVVNIFLHLDTHIVNIVAQYGNLTYLLLFLIIFLETGFVVTPFLPGDSLLFAAGAISASSSLNIIVVYIITVFAAIAGDTVNYWIGHYIGPAIFERDHKIIKREHLIKTKHFYDKHGGIAIVLARFVPIVRTFAPFVAGIAKMRYLHFIHYNIIGGVLWVSLFVWLGYFFGNLSFVKQHFHYLVIVIILISILPIIFEWLKSVKPFQKKAK